MPEQERPALTHRISVFSDDRQFGAAVVNSLGIDSALKVAVGPIAKFLDGTNPDHAADMVVVDVDQGQHLLDQRLFAARRTMNPSTPLMVVSGELPEYQLRDVVRLRAADWLRKPFSRRDMLEAVTKCLEKQEQAGRVIAIVSAVGGSGASVLAMNAAYMVVNPLRKAAKERSCMLFELDFSTGSCGHFLDIANDYDFRNVLENPDRIDAEFVDIIRKQHPSGFSLLSLNAPILQFHAAGEEIVLRILDVLTFRFDVVVVDVPYYETRWKRAVLEAVSDVVVVTEPVIPALRQARDLAQQLQEIRSESTVTIVVNKQRRSLFSRDLSARDISKVFSGRHLEFLPDAKAQLVEAANRGLVPIALDERSPYSRMTRRFLGRFL
jgi:pilus assembly protein CpaE